MSPHAWVPVCALTHTRAHTHTHTHCPLLTTPCKCTCTSPGPPSTLGPRHPCTCLNAHRQTQGRASVSSLPPFKSGPGCSPQLIQPPQDVRSGHSPPPWARCGSCRMDGSCLVSEQLPRPGDPGLQCSGFEGSHLPLACRKTVAGSQIPGTWLCHGPQT